MIDFSKALKEGAYASSFLFVNVQIKSHTKLYSLDSVIKELKIIKVIPDHYKE